MKLAETVQIAVFGAETETETEFRSVSTLTTPKSIRIQLAVLPLLTCADQQMGQAKLLSHKRSDI